ncbi:DUF805 domain-containing protein [Guptibacillus algicola]|uniref:DUF805 domain-containing protein n=1 Tax=Guptibacillus algicola TaxID=225844 RepID=UPI001CD55D59|nr:DUF805 domain-containing protein [Alkalihalobacillus algicola]MCA0987477.1 DUF805 domain-containing protein [Alkalihalobacillus algicola]
MSWYCKVLKEYVNFKGRARRKEYWMFFLVHVIICALLSWIQTAADFGVVLTTIYSLAVVLPALAVAVRRLHDTGKSGWWVLISFVPIVGSIILIVFLVLDSVDDNKYGANPKTAQI